MKERKKTKKEKKRNNIFSNIKIENNMRKKESV
jgi:hypothetical protein